ncbi:MAG: hypothetical protein GPOALKHO_002006 [Sodalis sp.]|nr:MAG: hypothetical protein GPOALKHO_002006 [Sodalis sp.]
MLISLFNGRIYPWALSDTIGGVVFIYSWPSIAASKVKVVSMSLAAVADLQTYQVLPPLPFSESRDI